MKSDHPEEPGPAPEDIDRLLAEYLGRVDDGEPIDPELIIEKHPDQADELRAFFDAVDLVNQLAGPSLDETRVEGSAASQTEQDDLLGSAASLPRRFGEYELLEEIGSGGMGIVYRARQTKLDRVVAVKVLRSGRFASEVELKRFYSEARAAGRLRHPNIINVHEVGEVNGRHFFSMDYVEGSDLGERNRDEHFDAQLAARTLHTVAEAIHSAHEIGILHRDIKPANIIIDADGRPHLTDFGLAKQLDDDSRLTTTGTAVGTPSFMSPEGARGSGVGPASDVYSLGAVLYALLAGRPPFRGRTPMDTVLQVLHKEADPPTTFRPNVAPDLETIALKCLEKDPGRRYASARELADELGRFLEGKPIQAQPIGTWRRCARWLREVPVFAALTGKTKSHPNAWHRRFQWGLLLVLVLAAVGLFMQLGNNGAQEPMPGEILIASAVRGGEYHRLSEQLAGPLADHASLPVRVLETEGSLDNREMLLAGEVSLALLQTSAIGAGEVAVVAPLYYDAVHVVVRRSSDFQSIPDLAGAKLSIGLRGSGMQTSALRLLQHFGVEPDESREPYVHFTVLADEAAYDAAIVTTGPRNDDLRTLLASGSYDLLPIPAPDREELTGPTFRTLTIRRGAFYNVGSYDVPADDLATLATTTFLATRRGAPDELVTKTLETLYRGSDLVSELDLLTRNEAAEWQMLDLHPAAREFFRAGPSGNGR